MSVFWIILFVLAVSGAGWVGFQMGLQVAANKVREMAEILHSSPQGGQCFTAEEESYYSGKEAAYEDVAVMLGDFCDKIDP